MGEGAASCSNDNPHFKNNRKPDGDDTYDIHLNFLYKLNNICNIDTLYIICITFKRKIDNAYDCHINAENKDSN